MEIKQINNFEFCKYEPLEYTALQMQQQAEAFYAKMNARRSCRYFSNKAVPLSIINQLLLTAGTAPSGAHKQPWTFCVVANAEVKKQIRLAAEAEEKESYENRMSEEWLKDLAPIGTDWQKPFLETAPYLIVVFGRSYEYNADGSKHQNYYVKESVGIACGLLIAAIQQAGLTTLTHTPSPMNFLSTLLQRPANEKPYLLLPVGYAASECWVPHLQRKKLAEIAVYY
jgi:iodotyrosine deiodinase